VAARHRGDAERLGGEVGDGRGQLVRRDLDARDVARGGVDAQHGGRSSDGAGTAAGGRAVLEDEAVGEERRGDGRDGRGGEPGQPGDVRPREGPSLADEVEDERPVQVAEELASPGAHRVLPTLMD
jgi:hypothetical protein